MAARNKQEPRMFGFKRRRAQKLAAEERRLDLLKREALEAEHMAAHGAGAQKFSQRPAVREIVQAREPKQVREAATTTNPATDLLSPAGPLYVGNVGNAVASQPADQCGGHTGHTGHQHTSHDHNSGSGGHTGSHDTGSYGGSDSGSYGGGCD